LILDRSIAGIIWMCLAMFLSAAAGACVRQLGAEVPTLELVFFRNIIGLLIFIPWLLRQGFGVMRTSRIPLYLLRVTFAYTAMVLLFFAWGKMPIADVFALQFTIPLFTIVLAVLILKQPTDHHSWVACFVGLVGALIVMRPGVIELTAAAAAAIASAMMSAGSNTTLKVLTKTQNAGTITIYSNLLMLPLALIPTFFVWVTPTTEQLPWVLGAAFFSAIGGLCFTLSVGAADARVVQPFQFTRMIFAALIGYLMFLELPDTWTWIGAAIIFISSYYIVLREGTQQDSNQGLKRPEIK